MKNAFTTRSLLSLAAIGMAALTWGCNGVSGASDVDLTQGGIDQANPPATKGLSCSYPEANYGTTEGTTVPVLDWQGIRPGSDTIGPLTTTEFIDCDGYKQSNALIFLTHRPG